MGISGLLPMLKEAQVTGSISAFKGKRLAVDAYVWLHKGAFGCAEDLVKGVKTTKFVDYAMYRVRLLRHHGITPFIVFDGGPLPAKKGTEVSRAKSRAENLARARAAESQGRLKEARDCYTKCVDITPEMAYQLIKASQLSDTYESVEYIVAPYEADAQLCFLEREGIVDGIITEDSDLLVFGCKQVIFKLDNDGNCVNIHRDRLAHIAATPMHGWTNTEFRRMAMISGCDYLPSLPGIGIKTAHKLLRRFKTMEKLLQHLRLEGLVRVPNDYVALFNQAELAFLHQRVYDPSSKQLRPLAPFPEGGLQADDEKWIGLELEPGVAQGLARGDLHPETYKPIEDQWPEYQPALRDVGSTSRVSNGPLATVARTNTPLPRGPMDAFITRKPSTPVLPRPVGVNGSGPSRLSDLVSRTASPTVEGKAIRRGSGGRALEAEAAAKRPGGVGEVTRSKFFGGGTQPAKPVREAPSPMKDREGSQLIWEASSEAGPEVDFEESQCRSIGRMSTTRVKVERDDREETSPVLSRLGSPTTPTDSRAERKGDAFELHPVTSPGAPLLSSPPNMTLSPLRPSHARARLEDTQQQFSSPPDIGRQRSLTADPFSPSPSPKSRDRAVPSTSFATPFEASATPRRVTGTAMTTTSSQEVHASSQAISSPTLPPSRILDSQPLMKTRSGWVTGSSDMLEEEEVVTPSYDVGVGMGYAGHAGMTEEREEIQASSDEEEVVRVKLEVEKRKERAQAVSVGWKQRFSLQSPPLATDRSPLQASPRPLKRRKTEPPLVPSSPSTPLSVHPTNVLGGRTASLAARVDAGLITPGSKAASKGLAAVGASRTPIPLSACAPRFLSSFKKDLPPSPAQVKLHRQAQATAQIGHVQVTAQVPSAAPATPVRAVENREGRSVVSRFRYSGPVRDLGGKTWL